MIFSQCLSCSFNNFKQTKSIGFQLDPKKIMTKTNTSCAHMDISKWKLAIAQLQSFNKCKTYVSLVFSTILSKTMFENNFQERNCTQGHNCKTKHFNHTLSSNYKGKWFFAIKSARLSINIFLFHIIFFDEIFWSKKFKYGRIGNKRPLLWIFSFNILFSL